MRCPKCDSYTVQKLRTFEKMGEPVGWTTGAGTGLATVLGTALVFSNPLFLIGAVAANAYLCIKGVENGPKVGKMLDENRSVHHFCRRCKHKW